jgi:hypothetical protein
VQVPGLGTWHNGGFKEWCADRIDGQWKHSWYWPEDWAPEALKNCRDRMEGLKAQLKTLESVEAELVEYIGEPEG